LPTTISMNYLVIYFRCCDLYRIYGTRNETTERVYLRQAFERPLLMTKLGLFGIDDITCSGMRNSETWTRLSNQSRARRSECRDLTITFQPAFQSISFSFAIIHMHLAAPDSPPRTSLTYPPRLVLPVFSSILFFVVSFISWHPKDRTG